MEEDKKTYRISTHFTVGALDVPPGPEREARIAQLMNILQEGLARCTTIDDFLIARQLRPWNATRRDGLPEPDVFQEVTVSGVDRDAVFERYRNDPAHRTMLEKIIALDFATWQAVVYQLPD